MFLQDTPPLNSWLGAGVLFFAINFFTGLVREEPYRRILAWKDLKLFDKLFYF